MKPTTVHRFLLLSSILLRESLVAVAAPVYEPIAGFRPTAFSPGSSLFRHSDGSFYGRSNVLYRVTPAGDFETFRPIPGIGSGRVIEARHFLETADGQLIGPRTQDGKVRGPNIFRFDPETELARNIAHLFA